MPTRAAIDDFLAQRRIAVVGVSRDPKGFANAVAREFADRGYEVFAVNEQADEIEGRPCFRSVHDLPEVDGVVVMVPAAAAAGVVDDIVERGIPRVWLHRGVGSGAVSDEAVAHARQAGLALVDGACPLMFLEPTAWFHRTHRFLAGRRIAA